MKKFNIKNLTNTNQHAFQRFHKKTKLTSVPRNEIMPYELDNSLKKIYYKSYPRFEEIQLPKPRLGSYQLEQALLNRNSNRSFASVKIKKKEISNLLYYSLGINSTSKTASRFYPSAGKKYPLEAYILSLNTELSKGLYHYYVPHNSLEYLSGLQEFSFQKAFTKYNQTWISNIALILIITGIFQRTFRQYGERGYRFTHIESGHVGQTLYLISSALSINCCAIGGFIDRYFEDILDIDGNQESLISAYALGKPQLK